MATFEDERDDAALDEGPNPPLENARLIVVPRMSGKGGLERKNLDGSADNER